MRGGEGLGMGRGLGEGRGMRTHLDQLHKALGFEELALTKQPLWMAFLQ